MPSSLHDEASHLHLMLTTLVILRHSCTNEFRIYYYISFNHSTACLRTPDGLTRQRHRYLLYSPGIKVSTTHLLSMDLFSGYAVAAVHDDERPIVNESTKRHTNTFSHPFQTVRDRQILLLLSQDSCFTLGDQRDTAATYISDSDPPERRTLRVLSGTHSAIVDHAPLRPFLLLHKCFSQREMTTE